MRSTPITFSLRSQLICYLAGQPTNPNLAPVSQDNSRAGNVPTLDRLFKYVMMAEALLVYSLSRVVAGLAAACVGGVLSCEYPSTAVVGVL